MVDQIFSEMIGAIAISIPLEDNVTIFGDDHLAFVLQLLEEDEVQNLEEKEHMIIRDGELANIIQRQEEDEAQKSIDKEQQAMASIPTRRALLLVQRVLSLHHFLQSSVTQNLGDASKVTTWVMYSMFFFADHLLRLQAVFIVAKKMPLWT